MFMTKPEEGKLCWCMISRLIVAISLQFALSDGKILILPNLFLWIVASAHFQYAMPAVVVLQLMVLMSNKVGCLLQLLLKSAYSALFPFLCFFLFLLISRICYLLLTTQIFIANNLFSFIFFSCLSSNSWLPSHTLSVHPWEHKRFWGSQQAFSLHFL